MSTVILGIYLPDYHLEEIFPSGKSVFYLLDMKKYLIINMLNYKHIRSFPNKLSYESDKIIMVINIIS